MTSKRTFSEDHLSRLQKGARRRQEEQAVGNYVRRVNRAAFQALLLEAVNPSSRVLDELLRQLGSAQSPVAPSAASEAPAVQEPVRRPPPPRMDID